MRFFRPISVFGLGNKPIVAGLETTVRWYRCMPGAFEMPWPHAFGLSAYGTPEEKYESSLGDVPDFNQWDAGVRPVNAIGDALCGTQEQWQTGFAWSPDLLPVPVQQSGIPVCCGFLPQIADGNFGLQATTVPAESAVVLQSLTSTIPSGQVELQTSLPSLQFSGGFTAGGVVISPTYQTTDNFSVLCILRMRFGQPSDYINPTSSFGDILVATGVVFGPTVAGYSMNLAMYPFLGPGGPDFLTCNFTPGDVVLWGLWSNTGSVQDGGGQGQGATNPFSVPSTFPLANANDNIMAALGSYSPTPPVTWNSPVFGLVPGDVQYTDGLGNQWGLSLAYTKAAAAGSFAVSGTQAGSLLYQWLGLFLAIG
jgi:hypothetical protein